MPPKPAVRSPPVVLLGGAYGSLALARSLKAAGFEVWLVSSATRCASFSNAVHRVVHWRGPLSPGAADSLEALACTHGLAGGVLVPCADADVRLAASAHERLSRTFDVLLTGWDQLQWACDKGLAYQHAQAAGVAAPRTYARAALEDPLLGGVLFPLVLKPAQRMQENPLTSARAWRVDDANAFARLYPVACELMGAGQVVAQDFIPGDGRNQFSYAGLWNRGEPVIAMTARRLRQYPAEFGSTSTYVVSETIPEARAAAETFLRSIGHHGLVEVEFKRDPRDGAIKLLDVNPRPWNWMGLAAAAGIDFGGAIAALRRGEPVHEPRARDGVAWAFVARDLASAAKSGEFQPRRISSYAATWTHVRKLACFSWADPLPGLVDIPATLLRMASRRFHREAVPSAG